MAQRRRYKSNRKPAIETHVFMGAMCAAWSALLSIIFYTFNINDPSWLYYSTEHTEVTNALGYIGAHIGVTLFYVFGAASYLFIPLLAGFAYVLWTQKSLEHEVDRFIAGGVGLLALSALCFVYRLGGIGYLEAGGVLGHGIAQLLKAELGARLAISMLWVTFVSSIIVVSRLSFIVLFEQIFLAARFIVANWRSWLLPTVRFVQFVLKGLLVPIAWSFEGIKRLLQGADVTESGESVFAFEHGQEEEHEAAFWQGYLNRQQHTYSASATVQPNHEAPRRPTVQPEKTKKRVDYSAPQPTLFDPTEKPLIDARYDQNKQLAQTLEEKLLRFGIAGTVTKIKPGPVITLFEYEPDMDAKVSKIQGLENDLALALEAMSVRIIAPIPGTSQVGFEVANKERLPVFMRDIVRSSTFQKTKAALPIVLGKDTAGDNVVVDMVDMPHLLVAGSTGSGKSVALNTLLVSLLCRLRPDELKLIIIDPKRLEFSAYQDIAHLLFPIITQPQKAAPVLRWLVRVMEERYELMAELGARSITDYKQMCKATGQQDELPYIILMIDELADLMMVARKDVEDSIARLAQMARAAGIHLIVATQRPSVDVLTGVIKVNFPSRMSFRVTSKIDSRTVLDALGAETLLGKGDMLFIDSHSSRMRRIHGAYVNDAEISRVVNHIKAQQKVEYTSLEDAVAAYNENVSLADEPLLPEVISYLETIDEISISQLQRRFKIGYNRSARLIEMLEAQGKIMPSNGGKMRKVIH